MINKLLRGTKLEYANPLIRASSSKTYDITEAYKTHNGLSLPKAPVNPYKKRPVKL